MGKYQTLYPRFWALILDSILLLPIAIIDDVVRGSALDANAKSALIIVLAFASTIYVILMHGFGGQTVGKMLLKVVVLDVSEKPLRFWQAVLRSAPQLLLIAASFVLVPDLLGDEPPAPESFNTNPFFLLTSLWGLADIIVFFTNDKRRALHDYIAGSVVVKIEQNKQA